MASKLYTKPEITIWSKRNADNLRKHHNFKFDIGDLVSKYPGCIWAIIDLGYDQTKSVPRYHLVREVGNNRKRWKSVWALESEIKGVFIA